MVTTCPQCDARFSLDDSRLEGRTVRLRCRRCSHAWVVGSGAAAAQGPRRARRSIPPMSMPKRNTLIPRERFEQVADLLDVPPALSAPPSRLAGPVSSGTAARHEHSVLFTVGAFRDVIRAHDQKKLESEGVVDLGALASAPPPPRAATPSPLPSEPPPGAFVREVLVGAVPPAHVRYQALGAIAVAASFVVALTGIGAAFLLGASAPKATADLGLHARRLAAEVVVAPPPVDAPEVAPMEASAPATTTAPATSSRPARPRARGTHQAATHAAATSAQAAPKRTKPADPCHCRGNLMCEIKCSAR